MTLTLTLTHVDLCRDAITDTDTCGSVPCYLNCSIKSVFVDNWITPSSDQLFTSLPLTLGEASYVPHPVGGEGWGGV